MVASRPVLPLFSHTGNETALQRWNKDRKRKEGREGEEREREKKRSTSWRGRVPPFKRFGSSWWHRFLESSFSVARRDFLIYTTHTRGEDTLTMYLTYGHDWIWVTKKSFLSRQTDKVGGGKEENKETSIAAMQCCGAGKRRLPKHARWVDCTQCCQIFPEIQIVSRWVKSGKKSHMLERKVATLVARVLKT